jgi:hypothetical protein
MELGEKVVGGGEVGCKSKNVFVGGLFVFTGLPSNGLSK